MFIKTVKGLILNMVNYFDLKLMSRKSVKKIHKRDFVIKFQAKGKLHLFLKTRKFHFSLNCYHYQTQSAERLKDIP